MGSNTVRYASNSLLSMSGGTADPLRISTTTSRGVPPLPAFSRIAQPEPRRGLSCGDELISNGCHRHPPPKGRAVGPESGWLPSNHRHRAQSGNGRNRSLFNPVRSRTQTVSQPRRFRTDALASGLKSWIVRLCAPTEASGPAVSGASAPKETIRERTAWTFRRTRSAGLRRGRCLPCPDRRRVARSCQSGCRASTIAPGVPCAPAPDVDCAPAPGVPGAPAPGAAWPPEMAGPNCPDKILKRSVGSGLCANATECAVAYSPAASNPAMTALDQWLGDRIGSLL